MPGALQFKAKQPLTLMSLDPKHSHCTYKKPLGHSYLRFLLNPSGEELLLINYVF